MCIAPCTFDPRRCCHSIQSPYRVAAGTNLACFHAEAFHYLAMDTAGVKAVGADLQMLLVWVFEPETGDDGRGFPGHRKKALLREREPVLHPRSRLYLSHTWKAQQRSGPVTIWPRVRCLGRAQQSAFLVAWQRSHRHRHVLTQQVQQGKCAGWEEQNDSLQLKQRMQAADS